MGLITANIICRNNALTIGRALASFSRLAEEVVVVDTGSTDNTLSIVRKNVDPKSLVLIESPWQNDSAYHRNEALAASHNDWIFVLDSDEWIESPTPAAARSMIKGAPEDRNAILVDIASLLGDGKVDHTWGLRIFRREGATWKYARHPQVLVSEGIRAIRAEIEIGHSGYADTEATKQKLIDTLSILEKSERDQHTLFWMADSYYKLGRHSDALDVLMILAESTSLSPKRRSEVLGLAAMCASHLGRFELAEHIVFQGVQIDPGNADFYFVRALVSLVLYTNAVTTPTGEGDVLTRISYTGHLLDQVRKFVGG